MRVCSAERVEKSEEETQMNRFKTGLTVLGATTLIVLLAAVLAPKTSHAVAAAFVQIVPGTTTHIGQTEVNMVDLICQRNTACEVASKQDGTGLYTFVIPDGYTFVLTDFSWTENEIMSTGYVCGGLQGNAGIFYGTVSCALVDGNGFAFHDSHFTTGIRFGSGINLGNALLNSSSRSTAQGYLIPN
jgi:hypothetical protein